jgi:uncharacterized protein YegJ (DUF2314 family)
LAHEANVDVSALYTVHVLQADEDKTACWLHTHGLAEIGAIDFDVMMPSRNLLSLSGDDLIRAIAYAILEGSVDANTPSHTLAYPRGDVRFVEVAKFNQSAPKQIVSMRDSEDPEHNEKRTVLCEPVQGLFGRWSRKTIPSAFLSAQLGDDIVIAFTDAASELMADRARKTFHLCRRFLDEFKELDFDHIVKLAYPTAEGGKEHLWFSIHHCTDSHIDATLENEPHDVPSLKHGMRSNHPIDLVTDWMILTPRADQPAMHEGSHPRTESQGCDSGRDS